jgi:hypothetical protein
MRGADLVPLVQQLRDRGRGLRAMDLRIQRSPGERGSVEKSATEARQGVTGHNVRYVLAISLGAAVLVLACLWLVFFGL